MLLRRYPVDGRSMGIELLGSMSKDTDDAFLANETANLRSQFDGQVRLRIAKRKITHLSVFYLAPMPLLVELDW